MFERLRELGASVEDVRSGAVSAAPCHSTLTLATKSGILTGITVGDVLEPFETQAAVLKRMTLDGPPARTLEGLPQRLKYVRRSGNRFAVNATSP
ncbi:hypothetical protein [Streptomyces sp. NPDC059166]|uniref:hypothetical protein n=1 Tax=Streptomyces sp. NPDC059166 TaxID=3346752 RepID=UPI0036CB6F3F